jgi:hypothetical protein
MYYYIMLKLQTVVKTIRSCGPKNMKVVVQIIWPSVLGTLADF